MVGTVTSESFHLPEAKAPLRAPECGNDRIGTIGRNFRCPVNSIKMVTYQDTKSVAVLLSKLTDAAKTLFPSAISDIKEINRVLGEFVDSDAETLNKTGDPRFSFEVEIFKQAIRDGFVTSDSFIQAIRSVALYASDNGVLQGIKEELSNSHVIQQQKLKCYLNVLKERLIYCRVCLAEIQSYYIKFSILAFKHKNRIYKTSPLSHLFVLRTVYAGPALQNVCVVNGFLFVKLLVSYLKPSYHLPLSDNGDSMEGVTQHPPVLNPNGTTSEYIYDYILPLLLLVFFGIGCRYLIKRSRLGICHYLKTFFRVPDVSVLQSVIDTLATSQSKLQIIINRLHDLEHCLSEDIDCMSALDEKDEEEIKSQLDKIQYEMNVLLTFMK